MRMAYLRKSDGMKRGNPDKENKATPLQVKAKMPASPVAPVLPIGKDKASQDRHLKMLQGEMKKVNPNKKIVQELVKRTFASRRKTVMDGWCNRTRYTYNLPCNQVP